MTPFRLSAIHLEMSRLLGPILREKLEFQVVPMTECWTFQHVCNWQIENKKHPYYNGGNGYEAIYPVEHEMALYFGAGHFNVTKETRCELDDLDRFEIRPLCELSEWIPVGQHFWTIRLWVKHPDGTITKHCFQKFSFSSSSNELAVPVDMRDLPPKRIAFKTAKVAA